MQLGAVVVGAILMAVSVHADVMQEPSTTAHLNGVKFAEDGGEMKLQLMTDQVDDGVVCLDGTAAGYYFAPAANSSTATKWQIYFQGGGWCYDEQDCWGRSKTDLGSSKSWPATSSIDGIMSSDCNVNPDFCNWNRVHIGYGRTEYSVHPNLKHISTYSGCKKAPSYCDGNSFSGNRDEPIVVNGDKVYFRGHRIVDAVLKSLMAKGLSSATDVLLTGCSAGGLATYLHADYVHDQLQQSVSTLKTFKALSISGFFLLHDTVEGKPVYPNQMNTIFLLSNATHGVNDKCIASKPSFLQWQCNFAADTYQVIESPFFVLNSAFDSWQTACIYTSEPVPPNSTDNGHCGAAPGWSDCSRHLDKCTTKQMPQMVNYETVFLNTIRAIDTYNNTGNGAFLYSCHTHCAGQTSAYNKFKINGVTMQEAVSQWWRSDTSTPAKKSTREPCVLNTQAPYECNPSCSA
ncbi:hypothetical protein PTSG_00161 [Salpingoeca rosetta]|uniref:Pectin acetylesterase n=1 Tax=Salpingoeca rosetta (strain ATCC 50818 / BSB-021) TaxID=946362 RepID=F2TVP5_SALR5|nr:uncharacterized protein PTSG_00161 [Salpingoeca rosetta]EGD72141.1 hypothetical protein PTSG_00161 [Salpingoeca rosetta]|eukprot:XP_004998713.1 hypothetical protein PTSG_00161 [Salpingoeca rosetta]